MSLLGIDIGTTGTKAIAFSEDGRVLAGDYAEYDLVFPNPGWVEFDVKSMWEKIFNVIRKVNSNPSVKKDPVTALSVSTVGESFTPIDEKGNTLYNTIYSSDSRSKKELEYIFTKIPAKELYNICGLPPQYVTALNKILWVKNNMPDIYLKTKKILFTEDLLHHKLGLTDLKLNHPICSTTLFFDIRKKKFSRKILDKFEIDENLFSEPCPSGVEIGYIRGDIAESLGFKKKVSIVTGGHDQQCAALGVGAVSGGVACDGIGTVECVTTVLDKLIIRDAMFENDFSTRAHVIDGQYVSFAYNLTAGSILKWYRDVLGSEEKMKAERKGMNIYDYFFSNLTFEPSGLYVLPYFSATGTPYHDPVAKGTVIGLNLATKKDDIFKALVEGLVYEIAFNIELAEKSGIKIGELRSVGGGAKSDYWLQLKSSVINKNIKRMKITEAGCLATMMLAGSGIGKFTVDEAVSSFVKVEKEFYPDESIRQRYLDGFGKYKKIYKLVSEIYKN